MNNYGKSFRKIVMLWVLFSIYLLGNSSISAKELISVSQSTTEYTNQNVRVYMEFSNKTKVTILKYVYGNHSRAYTEKNGKQITCKQNRGSVLIAKNGIYTILYQLNDGKKYTKKINIRNIDKKVPVMSPTYQVMNQEAIVSINGVDAESGLAYAKYIKGTLTDKSSPKWDTKAKNVRGVKQFKVDTEGNYSILLVDKAGNRSVKKISVMLELRGTWISYLEFISAGVANMDKAQFQSYIDKTFDKCKEMNQNTVIVQVRPSSDALYPSKYFPWSAYISGKQGKNPGYNPLAYMISAAHKRNLKFYAWLNPYRVSAASTSISSLYSDNPARKWRNSSDNSLKRNVLTYQNQLYYNPAKSDVQKLIVNGVKEIVKNYQVDGVVFDDYFYPNLGTEYKKNFDINEYKSYQASCKKKGVTAKSIVNWRRENVNTMLKMVKSAIKQIDSKVEFGVSPQGNIGNLQASNSCYCDIETWMNSKDYIDFICPQIYWSTTNPAAPYEKVLNQWLDLRKKNDTKMYVAIAVYKAGMSKKEANALSPADLRWYKSNNNLMEQVTIGRDTGCVDGFMFYRYDNMISSKTEKEMKNLLSIL